MPAGKRRRPPRILVSGDLAVLFPRGSAKTTSNICIVGHNPTVLIDAGGYWDPGAAMLRQALERVKIAPQNVTTICVTHSHVDHVGGLSAVLRVLPNARIYCHAQEEYNVVHHFRALNAWKAMFQYNNFAPVVYWMYRAFLTGLDFMQAFRSQRATKIVAFRDEEAEIPFGQGIIRAIHTPGHSAGHTCYLTQEGDLFLGDHVPRTPWLDPNPGSLRDQIQSIERLLHLPLAKVRRAIRSHANVRDKGRTIYPWAEERERFRQHLDLIHETIENIPKILKNRELTVPQLVPAVMRSARRYSNFMTDLYIDPNTTWVSAYLEHLEGLGQVTRRRRRGKIWWAA